MKRPSASGATSLEFTPVDFLRRVAALIAPPRVNLVRFFGVLAPNARLRSLVVPAPPPELSAEPPPPPMSGSLPSLTTSDEKAELEGPTARPSSRIPWADLLKRTFGVDLGTCTNCGGKRRVVACVFSSMVRPRWRITSPHGEIFGSDRRGGVAPQCGFSRGSELRFRMGT